VTSPEPQTADHDPATTPSGCAAGAASPSEHTLAVSARAGELANRLTAARTLGTLISALQPLEAHRHW
jgi:hypothetical protein